MAKIPKTKPPREACKRCFEWVDEKTCDKNDFPHCTQSSDFFVRAFMAGRIDFCPRFNEW